MMESLRRLSALVLVSVALPACGTLEPIFPEIDPPLVWPSGGEPARFAYVGQIRGEKDLKRPRSFWSRLAGLFVGDAPPAEIQSASGVAVTPQGVLYVSDAGARAVHRFDLESREYRRLEDAGEERRFEMPLGLALRDDSLLVADRALGLVAVLSLDGETAPRVLGEKELRSPVGVAVGPFGRIYVADVGAHAIQVFDPGGGFEFSFGRRGVGEGQFNFPTHVACDSTGVVYVSDSLNSRVQAFWRGGRYLRSWGQPGDGPGDFSQPKGIACDRRGRVYVVDSHFENVQIFSALGELLLSLGEEGTGPGQFWLPVGIFVDDRDHIWICDSYNRRIQVFRYLGEPGIPEASAIGGPS